MAEEISQPPTAPQLEASAQVVPATPPVAASSAADQTTPPNSTPTKAAPEDAKAWGSGADVAAYQKEMDDFLAGRLTSPAPAVETPKEPEAIAPEPAATPPAATATEAAPAAAPKAEDDEDAPLPTDGSLPKNLKLKVQGAFDFEVMTLRKRGYDWSTAQEMAAKRYPESPEAKALAARQPSAPAPGAAPTSTPETAPEAPQTVAQVDAAIEAADDAYNAAVINFDEAAMKTARAEIRRLSALRQTVADQEARAASTHQQEFETEFNDYLQQAELLYPAAKDPASPLSQRAAAIQAQLGRDGSPLFNLPESALIVYQRAAKELGVQPSPSPVAAPAPAVAAPVPSQAATPAPQPPPRPRSPGAALIAGGNARTQRSTPEVDFSKMTRKEYDAIMDQYKRAS